jgi:hypothetical protein
MKRICSGNGCYVELNPHNSKIFVKKKSFGKYYREFCKSCYKKQSQKRDE